MSIMVDRPDWHNVRVALASPGIVAIYPDSNRIQA